ncbi:MAG: CAP domain-containing protein [Bacteroidetes bacterium]|nr:CAP domain-containing protein [Bacteroidota bacterium]
MNFFKIFLFITFSFLLSFHSVAIIIPDSIITKCNTAKDIQILSANEKNVIFLTNIVRCYPKFFLDSFLVSYMDSAKTNKKTKYYKSLIIDLNNGKPLKPLIFDEKLYSFAFSHAKDMGKHGLVGHNSSNGDYRPLGLIGENCSYGYEKPIDILFQLLLDEGVPSLGHRENILEPSYKTIGVSIFKHKKYKWNCVMDFS